MSETVYAFDNPGAAWNGFLNRMQSVSWCVRASKAIPAVRANPDNPALPELWFTDTPTGNTYRFTQPSPFQEFDVYTGMTLLLWMTAQQFEGTFYAVGATLAQADAYADWILTAYQEWIGALVEADIWSWNRGQNAIANGSETLYRRWTVGFALGPYTVLHFKEAAQFDMTCWIPFVASLSQPYGGSDLGARQLFWGDPEGGVTEEIQKLQVLTNGMEAAWAQSTTLWRGRNARVVTQRPAGITVPPHDGTLSTEVERVGRLLKRYAASRIIVSDENGNIDIQNATIDTDNYLE